MFGMKMPMFSAYLKKTDETVRAERKKKTYRKAFNTILEQAVEVPICQKQKNTVLKSLVLRFKVLEAVERLLLRVLEALKG